MHALYGITDEIHQTVRRRSVARSARRRSPTPSGGLLGALACVAIVARERGEAPSARASRAWMKIDALRYDASSGSASMLPDERTTHATSSRCPARSKGLVVAPGRAVARPLVAFLRGEGINVRTVADADAAFEEALLHPPDVVLIDDRVPPAGGIDLVAAPEGQRPHALRARDPVRAQRSAARTGARPRGRRRRRVRAGDRRRGAARPPLGAAAHARAVPPRRARAAHADAARSSTAGTGCRTSCTTSRGRSARWRPTSTTWRSSGPSATIRGAPTSTTASRTRAASSSSSRPASAPCIDYDRFESGQLVAADERFALGEAAAEAIDDAAPAGGDGRAAIALR